jgi:putative phage-type endonuclease
MTQFITPRDEAHWLDLRTTVLTSTEVSALFDQSPYMTAFELWHRKAGRLDSAFEESERTRWGTRLQDAIAMGVAEDNGWKVRRMDEFAILPELRAGSSFDFCIGDESNAPTALLEIKNVDHWIAKEGWIVERDGTDDYIEAPVHIEMQIQHQMLVSGVDKCYLAALVGGNRILLSERTPDPVVQDAIKQAITEFWRSIDAGEEPVPNFERDAEVIFRLYGNAVKGKAVDADEKVRVLCEVFDEIKARMKPMEKACDGIRAEILTRIGDASKAVWEGGSVSASMVKETQVSYARDAYRTFKVSIKKSKAAEADPDD